MFFFVISRIKRGRSWRTLVHCFLNKFAAVWYTSKHFPLHLNDVFTLPCETWNTHRIHTATELLQKETPEFICGLQIQQIWFQLITTCGKYYKRRCTKHASLIWSYQRRHWWMFARMTTWPSLANSILSRCFISSRSVMHILYTFCCNSPHTLISWIEIWQIWGHSWGEINSGVSFC